MRDYSSGVRKCHAFESGRGLKLLVYKLPPFSQPIHSDTKPTCLFSTRFDALLCLLHEFTSSSDWIIEITTPYFGFGWFWFHGIQ